MTMYAQPYGSRNINYRDWVFCSVPQMFRAERRVPKPGHEWGRSARVAPIEYKRELEKPKDCKILLTAAEARKLSWSILEAAEAARERASENEASIGISY